MDAHSEALSLFTQPGVNSGVESTYYVQHLPINQVGGGNFIEFSVQSPDFIDLSRSTMCIKAKVVCGDDTDIKKITGDADYDKAGDVVPTNLLIYSLFDKVDFSIQHQSLSSDIPSHTFPYKMMLDTLLTETKDENIPLLYVKDLSKALNACSAWKALDSNPDNAKGNTALKTRYKVITKSREFEMEGKLGIDFCDQKRYLLNNCTLSIRFWQSQPAFSLLSASTDVNHKIKITDFKLKLCHVKLSPELVLAINESCKLQPISYPYQKSVIRTHSIAKGSQSATINDLFSDKCPDKMLVVLTSAKNYIGSYDTNPFFFDSYKLNEIGFYLDNYPLPGKPMTLKFDDNAYESDYVEAYRRLREYSPQDFNISFTDFARGYTILAFDFSNGETGDLERNERRGQTRLEMRFAEALNESVNVIVYGKFNSCLTIDQARNATLAK